MYNELYNAWKREKESVNLQSLPKDFYVRAARYLKKIREESRMLDAKTVKARLMRRESENVKRLVQELVWLRYGKIMRAAAAGEVPLREALTAEEERVHDGVAPLTEFYKNLLGGILRGRPSATKVERRKRERPRKIVVRFLRDIPAIIGADMKTYGPFKSEDVATLPIENAKVLIKQGVAAEVDTDR